MLNVEDHVASLSGLSALQLKMEWQRVMRSPPPDISVDLLERALAFALQSRAHGGLPPRRRREIARLAKQLSKVGHLGSSGDVSLQPGTRLARDWHGRTHNIVALEDGFLYEERRFTSLSQIATAITGTKWSGPRFFGLKRPAASRDTSHAAA